MNGLIRELKVGSKLLTKEIVERASKYIVLTGDDLTDFQSIVTLEMLRLNVVSGTSNDICKYNLGESYKTSLVWTVNARTLQNFLHLRTDKAALWEIRELANNLYVALPDEHKYLFEHCIYTEEPKDG